MKLKIWGFCAFVMSIVMTFSCSSAASQLNTVKGSQVSEWRYFDICVAVILFFYYAVTWYLYGRYQIDEKPVFSITPPDDLSPGLLRFIRDGRLDSRAISSEILNSAVQEHIHVDSFTAKEKLDTKPDSKSANKANVRYSSLERMMGRKYRLRLVAQQDEIKSVSESILLHNLFLQDRETEITLDTSCAGRLKLAFKAFTRNFTNLANKYTFRQMKRWLLGLIFFEAYTAFVMFDVLSKGAGGIEPDSEHALAFMAPLFLLAPFLDGFLGGKKTGKQSTILFIIKTSIPLVFCACALILLKQQGADQLSIIALMCSVATIGLFWKLAPVNSKDGIELINKIHGFQLGLSSKAELKEGDTIEKFEYLFPYAYALDLERTLISRYDPLISQLRHYARWHTADTHSFAGGAEYYSLSYELGEAINDILCI